MKDKLSSFEWRIGILFTLTKYRESTIDELANMFSVCRKTAYNDLIFLSRYAPIYTKSGIGGGVYILEEYRSELFVYLSVDEEKLLQRFMESLDGRDKHLIKCVLARYSMPKINS